MTKSIDKALRKALRTPWWEYVLRFLIWRKDRKRKKMQAKYNRVANRYR